MHPIKLLAKMSPKTLNINNVGSSSAIDVIDWSYAAHALTGLKKEAYDWALFRFAGHDEKITDVTRTLTMIVTMYAKIERLKIKPGTLNGIVKSAILEFTQPVCNECSGTGWQELKGEQIQCRKCQGRGKRSISNRERCKVIGINHKSYTDSHDLITREVLKIITDWEIKIIKNVREKMGEVA